MGKKKVTTKTASGEVIIGGVKVGATISKTVVDDGKRKSKRKTGRPGRSRP
jgi:hypothetical protein